MGYEAGCISGFGREGGGIGCALRFVSKRVSIGERRNLPNCLYRRSRTRDLKSVVD